MEGHDNSERPQFARSTSASGAVMVDLRGDVPRRIVDVLDAIAIARDVSRAALMGEVLGAWADKVVHEATVVARVAGLNAHGADTERGSA